MKKVYLLLLGIMTMSEINAQQIELKVLTGMGSRLYDINDNGKGIHSGAYYDFEQASQHQQKEARPQTPLITREMLQD